MTLKGPLCLSQNPQRKNLSHAENAENAEKRQIIKLISHRVRKERRVIICLFLTEIKNPLRPLRARANGVSGRETKKLSVISVRSSDCQGAGEKCQKALADRFESMLNLFIGHINSQIHHTVCVTELVIIPGQNLYHIPDCHCGKSVYD